jgi:hypothetical protein
MITVGMIRKALEQYKDDCQLRFSVDSMDWSESGLRIFCEEEMMDCFHETQGPGFKEPIEVTICLVGSFNYPNVVCYLTDE